MRPLDPAPDTLFDPLTSLPRVGSFRGPLPLVDWSPFGRGALYRVAHHKRWVYVAMATEELFVAAAIVDLSYASSAFAFVADAREGRLLADASAMGHPLSARVGPLTGHGCLAYFRAGKTVLRFNRSFESSHYSIAAEAPGLRIDARLESEGAPSPIAAVAPVEGGLLNATEKRALLAVKGEVTVDHRTRSLDGALGGFDYTNGYLARRTAWRWAYALGRAVTGERVGMNLVEGFVGEPECAVWVDGSLYPVGEGRISFDRADFLKPWFVATADESVDLRFSPCGVHTDQKNYGLIASHFRQAAGSYRGTIRLPGRAALELDGVLGVTEDQDVLW